MLEQKLTNYRNKILHGITDSVDQMLSEFLGVMPQTYFETNDEETVLQHLSAILLAHNAGNHQQIVLARQDASQQTFIQLRVIQGCSAIFWTSCQRTRACSPPAPILLMTTVW